MAKVEIAERLRELEQANGRLIPSDVVEEARNPESPLHSHFEWDNSEAATKYRLLQAGVLIRSVKLEITVRDVPLSVVGYVRDPDLDTKTAGYRNVINIRSEEDAARSAIIDEMKRVSNAVRRAKSLAAVLGFVEDIERIDELARTIVERATVMSSPEATA